MRFVRLVAVGCVVMAMAASAFAELCPACKGKSYTKDIGECSLCGAPTMSGQFKLCMGCSKKLGQCEHCRAPLPAAEKLDLSKDGTHSSGPWQYTYTIAAKGTRSEGYHGLLLYDGAAVPVPEGVNDYYATPWGPLYWVGNPTTMWGGHGWMPKPKAGKPAGKALAAPKAKEKK